MAQAKKAFRGKSLKKAWRIEPFSQDSSLLEALKTIAEGDSRLKFAGQGGGSTVRFVKAAETGLCRVSLAGSSATIEYGAQPLALRGLGALLSGLVEDGSRFEERSPFSTFGIMLDCSRNAVMKVEHFKRWLERLSLLGYNMAMLYTEDVYELDGEPSFGYLRGPYSTDELKEIDAYAARLGIEMIPCIQALGHLEQALSWSSRRDVKDTRSVLLVDEPKTYELIDKALAHWSSVFKSRRVHVGMDETHDLGRGRFYDLHGDERHFNIFNRHLAKVSSLCAKRGLSPMIWSDMYFRMGSANMDYYDLNCKIPKDVAQSIPDKAELVYWDYYHQDEKFYLDWIERHRKLGREPLMGSGVWTWSKFWHHMDFTVKNAAPCVEACRKAGLKEVFFTMWGDDGGYCDFDSAMAGLLYVSELAFRGEASTEIMEAKGRALFGASWAASALASELENVNWPAPLLWSDPLLLPWIYNSRLKNPKFLSKTASDYAALAKKLSKAKKGSSELGRLELPRLLAEFLSLKSSLLEDMLQAYRKRDLKALKAVVSRIPAARRKLRSFSDAFRKMWLENNKPFGLEVMQIRFAGQDARLGELAQRLSGFASGKLPSIPELDANLRRKDSGDFERPCNYRELASGSLIL